MYPSNSYYANNNHNNDSLISSSYNPDQTLQHKPFIYEINSNYEQEAAHPHSLCYNVPSPYNHYEHNDTFVPHIYDPYLQQQYQITEANAPDPITTQTTEDSQNTIEIQEECKMKKNESVVIGGIPRKRTSNKDRHSKIETAQGPRDRRMRLSLQVARDFFDLQDMLGYNKPSKTVEWLLTRSEAAIKDLTSSNANSPSSTSEGEVVSREKGQDFLFAPKETKGTRGPTRKFMYDPLAKESREKARERARVRAREKRKVNGLKSDLKIDMSHQMNQSVPWSKTDINDYQLEIYDVGDMSSSMIFNFDIRE